MPSRPRSGRRWAEQRKERTMAKGYWIGRVGVHNEDGYKAYAAANPAIFKKFGGRYVVRGGKFTGVEGESRSRNVVIEFADYKTALACYRSPEYQQNIKGRQPHAIADLLVVEVYDGQQPYLSIERSILLCRHGRAIAVRRTASLPLASAGHPSSSKEL